MVSVQRGCGSCRRSLGRSRSPAKPCSCPTRASPRHAEDVLKPRCYNCEGPGHVASDCELDTLCGICLQSDHHVSECPYCSVVTSVNHTSTRSEKRTSHSPCSQCERVVNKIRVEFNLQWFHLNGTTPHLSHL